MNRGKNMAFSDIYKLMPENWRIWLYYPIWSKLTISEYRRKLEKYIIEKRKNIRNNEYFEMRNNICTLIDVNKKFLPINQVIKIHDDKNSTFESGVLITKESGFGKTILLLNIALEILKNRANCIPILIDLDQPIKFNEYIQHNDEKYLDFIRDYFSKRFSTGLGIVDETNVAEYGFLIQKLFKKGELIILIDNYDLILRMKIDEIVSKLINENNSLIKKNVIVIASKPILLQNIPGCVKYEIAPLSLEEVEKYLKATVKQLTKDTMERLVNDRDLKTWIECPYKLLALKEELNKNEGDINVILQYKNKIFENYIETLIQEKILKLMTQESTEDGIIPLTKQIRRFLEEYADLLIKYNKNILSENEFAQQIENIELHYKRYNPIINLRTFETYKLLVTDSSAKYAFELEAIGKFLAASNLFNKGIISADIKQYFLFHENDVLVFLSGICENYDVFKDYFEEIMKYGNVLLIANILKSSHFRGDYEIKVLELLKENIGKEFYSFNNLEALDSIGDVSTNFLARAYKESKDNNTKRRIVYYFGLAGKEFTEDMINDLANKDLHLVYHIIRGLGDAAEKNEALYEVLAHYAGRNDDPIFQSDRLWTLRRFKKSVERGKGDLMYESDLLNLLQDKKYWIRAHAAGAIGRLYKAENVYLLTESLENEINRVQEKNDQYAIKSISYHAEAICECFKNKEKDSEHRRNAVIQLIKIIGTIKNNDYYYITTAIENLVMTEDKVGPPAFKLGARFRDLSSTERQEIKNILKWLESYPDYAKHAKIALEKLNISN